MSKQKFYVVWKGRKTGIFKTWEECQKQIFGFPGATYKSYKSLAEAHDAFKNSGMETGGSTKANAGTPVWESISVDAACNVASGDMEYQGVDTKTKKQIFRMGPYPDGTNNVGEFLAIVHALAYCKENKITSPIYSDSQTALVWVRNKKIKTTLDPTPRNRKIFELLQRAENWLKENTWANPLLKWETHLWGENPADFGRK